MHNIHTDTTEQAYRQNTTCIQTPTTRIQTQHNIQRHKPTCIGTQHRTHTYTTQHAYVHDAKRILNSVRAQHNTGMQMNNDINVRDKIGPNRSRYDVVCTKNCTFWKGEGTEQ
jgi:hypothetical protein